MSTGSELRERRELAGLSLEQLVSLTSVRMGLLNEMESNNFSHCGGDTYARGHLKNIALRLSLDPNHFVEMYNAEHSLDQRAIHDLLVENNVGALPREARKRSWKIPALISIIVLVTIGTVQIVMSNQSNEVTPVVSAEKSTPTPKATPTPLPSVTPSTPVVSGKVALTLSASKGNSYFNVVIDGKSVEKASLFQGDTKSYVAKTTISIYLSNPAGVDVTHNGKLLSPLGGQNQEVRRTFR